MSKVTEYIEREQALWEDAERLREYDNSSGQREWQRLFDFLKTELDGRRIGNQDFDAETAYVWFGNHFARWLPSVDDSATRSRKYAIQFGYRDRQFPGNDENGHQWPIRLAFAQNGAPGWLIAGQSAQGQAALTNEELGLRVIEELVRLHRDRHRAS